LKHFFFPIRILKSLEIEMKYFDRAASNGAMEMMVLQGGERA